MPGKPVRKNAPRSFNTLNQAVETVLRRAWRTCSGDRPVTPELQAAAEQYVAEMDARNIKAGRGTIANQKRTILALVVGCEYAIANWREADRTGAWPIPGEG